MNACHVGALLTAGLLLATPVLAQGMKMPEHSQAEPRYALQACVWPERYRRCLDKCDWKKRQYEDSGDCIIDPDPGGASTCREREVSTVRACIIRCKADYCPQYNP